MLNNSTNNSSNGLNQVSHLRLNTHQSTINDSLIPKSQIKEAVKEVLLELLGIESQERVKQWYDVNEAFKLLDLKSAKQLREMIRSGVLRIGQEIRDCRSPSSRLPRYQVHVQRSLERLQKPPEKRR